MLAAAFTIVGLTAIPAGDAFSFLEIAALTIAALSLVLSGAVLISRLPRNPIGWLLWGGGLLFTLANGSGDLAAALATTGIGGGVWVFWLSNVVWVPALVSVAVWVPLLFPTGHLPSSRWRGVVIVGAVATIFIVIQSAFSPFAPGSTPAGMSNPLAVGGALGSLSGLVGGVSALAGIVCLPLVAASLAIRYRRASGIERAQLKWFAAVVAVMGPALAIGIAAGQVTSGLAAAVASVAFLTAFVGLALLPVAIGIAVLRYRLYDIDIIVRRTAVYVPLTAILAGLYAASIALLQRLFITATGGPSDGAVILSTLILATTFTPIKGWLQGIVDRRFGAAQDAARQLDAFATGLSTAAWAPDPARTMRAFLAVIVHALGATGGVAYVGSSADERLVSQTPAYSGRPALVVWVEAAGQRIGRVELEPLGDGRPYRDPDIEMIHSAGERVAAAVIGLLDVPPAAKIRAGASSPSVIRAWPDRLSP